MRAGQTAYFNRQGGVQVVECPAHPGVKVLRFCVLCRMEARSSTVHKVEVPVQGRIFHPRRKCGEDKVVAFFATPF